VDVSLSDVLVYSVVGFTAQLIDGSLGMAYGVSSTTFLLSVGVSPVMASASVHTAEVFTTAASGLSHIRLGNFNPTLFKRLLLPGMIGGFTGAYILSNIDGDAIKPFIALYLLVMGIVIIRKGLQRYQEKPHLDLVRKRKLTPLALTGGFFDAIGGGGWGPIVTSTLVAAGHSPRLVIGSVNAAEFFVTLVQMITFFVLLGTLEWEVVAGLIIGGVPAAPFAAMVCRRVSPRKLMLVVGILILLLSLRTILLSL
jgi:uncharacterized protein